MSTSFGAEAGAYESGRPEYPIDAVAWMLRPVTDGARSIRVADVGAGTGKLTRAVRAAASVDIVAIDPDSAMLDALRAAVPGVPTIVGRAESLPLPDRSVDAAVLGQAWHWVDVERASREIGRVLRMGGVLGLIWNVRDEREPWLRRLMEIMGSSAAEEMVSEGAPPVAAPFESVVGEEWPWVRPMTRAQVLAMARSRSRIITASEAERDRIIAGIEDLLDEIGAVGDATIDMPYVTHAFRVTRD